MLDDSVTKLITKRRRQIVIHSCIYYIYGKALITDKQFDNWAYELADFQKKYPENAKAADWAYEFKTFDGTTGYDLPILGAWVLGKSEMLIDYAEKHNLLL